MPSWFPLSGSTIQRIKSDGTPASGYVLKLYAAGTSTNIPLATDSTGNTQANYATFNANGDVTVSNSVIIPHIDQDYKYAIYPTQAAADADSGATLTVDNVALATVNITLATLGVTSTATELNALDGIPATLTATELGYVDGVTSAIQTQLNAKVGGPGVSVDSEIMLFSSTGGYTAKRATGTGIATVTSGVLGTAVSGTDLKTINSTSIIGSGDITTAAGALIYLSTVSPSGASTVDVETGFGSTYDNYVIIGSGIDLSGADQIKCQFKLGGAYVSTSTYYSAAQLDVEATAAAASGNVTNTSINDASIVMDVFDVNSANQKKVQVHASGSTATPGIIQSVNSTFNSGTGVLTGVRFFCASSATITGSFYLYGVTKT